MFQLTQEMMADNETFPALNSTTKSSTLLAQRQIIYKVFLTRGILSIPLALITSFSNGLVVFLFFKDPKRSIRSSPTSLLVASLAFIDFLVGCALEPTNAYWHLAVAFGKKPSLQRKDLQSFSAYLLLWSVLQLLLITLDRHLAVSRPIQYTRILTRERAYTLVIAVWLYCTLLIVVVREWTEKFRNEIFCGHVDFALIVTIAVFCGIVRSLRKQTRNLKRLSVNSEDVYIVQATEREKKVTLTLGFMLVVFLACTLPWFLMMQIFVYCTICQKNWWILKLLFVLFQANCALNPFLCTLRLPRYKTALKLFCRGLFYRRFRPFWRKRSTYRPHKKQRNLPCKTADMKRSPTHSSSTISTPVLTQFQGQELPFSL